MRTVMTRQQNLLGALAGVFVLVLQSAALAQLALAQLPAPPQPPAHFSRPADLYDQALHSIDRGQLERAIEQLDRLIRQFDGQTAATAAANKVDGAFYWKAYTQIRRRQLADALTTI